MYSPRLIELFHSRVHAGALPDATHRGVAGTPGGGPYMQLWARIIDGTVVQVSYKTYGCPAAIASGEALCRIIEGRAVSELESLSESELVQFLDGIPDEKVHCPPLAIRAWHERRPIEE